MSEDMVVPRTYCGQELSCNNPTAGAVAVEMARSGMDPLLGTGLTYGKDLVYDVSPVNNNPEFGVVSPGPEAIGSPASPSTAPGSYSNPYPGKGSF